MGILPSAARIRRRTSKPSIARQAHVEDHEVRRLVGGIFQAFLAGSAIVTSWPSLLEGVLDAARHRVLVFDDENRARHLVPIVHRPGAGSARGTLTLRPGARPHPAAPPPVERSDQTEPRGPP